MSAVANAWRPGAFKAAGDLEWRRDHRCLLTPTEITERVQRGDLLTRQRPEGRCLIVLEIKDRR